MDVRGCEGSPLFSRSRLRGQAGEESPLGRQHPGLGGNALPRSPRACLPAGSPARRPACLLASGRPAVSLPACPLAHLPARLPARLPACPPARLLGCYLCCQPRTCRAQVSLDRRGQELGARGRGMGRGAHCPASQSKSSLSVAALTPVFPTASVSAASSHDACCGDSARTEEHLPALEFVLYVVPQDQRKSSPHQVKTIVTYLTPGVHT